MGGKNSTSTTKTELPPEIVKAYEGLIGQATPISQTAYQPYAGGVGGSGFEQNQLTGFNTIANLAGASNGYFGNAANSYGAAPANAAAASASTAIPTSAMVGGYMSPYLSNVVNATVANMNEQNAEQQQGVLGNAAAQGALGGNRIGVAQAELARQQNLANQQTISGLYNQGYNTALGAAQSDKAANLQASQQLTNALLGSGEGLSNLGQTAMQTNLAQAAAQVGAGTQQQQWNYQQYQNARSYPFETTSWLANIVEGLGSGMGGTTTSKQPSGNTGSAVLGGILGLASLFNKGGVVRDEDISARPRRAQGGIIPYSNPSGILSANNNNPAAANDNGGYVPQVATAGIAPGRSTLPQAPQGGQQQDQGQQMLQQGIKAEQQHLQQKYPNGILAGLNQPTPTLPTPRPDMTADAVAAGAAAPQSSGLMSGLASLFGFADGGVIKGYDDGGYVEPDPLLQNGIPTIGYVPPRPIVVLPARPVTPTPGVISADTQAADARLDLPAPIPADVAAAQSAGGGLTPAPALPPPTTINDVPMPAGVVAPDQSQGVVPSNVPVPTPRPYVDQQTVASTGVNSNADSGTGNSGVIGVPANSHLPSTPKSGNQQVYDPFMNTVRSQVTNPYGLAAIASTGIHESGFSPNEAYGDWQDGKNRAGGIMSWNGDRLANLRSYVKQQGGTGNGTSEQQAQFFLQENPDLIKQLNAAKSPQEAQQIMNNAWRFKGYDQPGNKEAAARINQAVALAPQFSGDVNATIPAPTNDAQLPNYSASSTRPTTPFDAPQNAHAGVLGGVGPTTESSQTNLGGIFGNVGNFLSGKGGHLLNLSDDQRMALLSAGLGMMAGTSPNALTNIGTGGLKGVEAWNTQKQRERENALAASNIETQKADVALRGKELALLADKAKSEIGEQTARTSGINTETAIKRWNVINTPQGMLIRDATNPTAQPQFYSWQNIQTNGLPPQAISNETIGAQASGAQGTAPASTSAAPTISPNNAPVTAAPTQAVGAPQQFVTKAPDNIPFDGRNFSDTGKSLMLDETKAANDKAAPEARAAQSANLQLAEMRHDMDTANNSWFTQQGAGFTNRVAAANWANTAASMMGAPLIFDPQAVAAGQDLNKISTRLGFDLSQTLGSREAASVVDQAVSAVPGGYNSKEGAKRIIAGIEAGNQRKIDYYNFLQDWQAKSGGSIKDADAYFNQVNPPEKYANMALLSLAIVPQSQADIDNAPTGTMFNDNGILRIKK